MLKPEASKKFIYIIVLVFIFLTIFVVAYKILNQNIDELPTGDSAWKINLTVLANANKKGATVKIPRPWDTPYSRMYAQSVSHYGLREKKTGERKKNREIILVATEPGSYAIKSEFSVQISSIPRKNLGKSNLREVDRSLWLKSEKYLIQINTSQATNIIKQLSTSTNSTDGLIEKIFDYVSNNTRIKKRTNNNSETVLSKQLGTELGVNRALVALLRTAHIPARIITGVDLFSDSKKQPVYWTEVYYDQRWFSLNPSLGFFMMLPAQYIPLVKGKSDILGIHGMQIKSIDLDVTASHVSPSLLTTESKHLSGILNLNRLSPDDRENLGILLLMPLGILITEILRQIVGVRTYGTFTPTLLALAVVHVDLKLAMIIFLIVTIIGISIRSLLPLLHLKRTPLLSVVFTLVVLSMAFIISFLHYLDPEIDSVVVLLPVVILTMLIDRIYAVMDQRKFHTAMLRLFWTITAALFSLFVLLQSDLGQVLVSYPELHALTLAIIILIGTGSTLNLTGIKLLNWMFEPDLRIAKKNAVVQSEQSDDIR